MKESGWVASRVVTLHAHLLLLLLEIPNFLFPSSRLRDYTMPAIVTEFWTNCIYRKPRALNLNYIPDSHSCIQYPSLRLNRKHN